MAKKVRVSPDNGTTWYTLPGNQAEWNDEASQITDTVFGQDYESNQPGIVNWTASSNALYKGFAGYVAIVKQGGTPTTMTAEAMSLVSGKTYQITAGAKRVISYADALTVYDNAVDHTADVDNIDYLTGKVTFKSAYTPTTPITITGKYMPMATIARARGFNLTQNANMIDDTDFETAAANSGQMVYKAGLKTINLELQGIYALSNGWRAALLARSLIYVEISLDAAGATKFVGFFKPQQRQQQGNVGEREDENVTLNLWVPDGSLVNTPFNWVFTSSTLNLGVQACLNAFLAGTNVDIQYLEDGAAGKAGDAFISEASLSNAIDGMCEFKLGFRGTGAVTAVP